MSHAKHCGVVKYVICYAPRKGYQEFISFEPSDKQKDTLINLLYNYSATQYSAPISASIFQFGNPAIISKSSHKTSLANLEFANVLFCYIPHSNTLAILIYADSRSLKTDDKKILPILSPDYYILVDLNNTTDSIGYFPRDEAVYSRFNCPAYIQNCFNTAKPNDGAVLL